MTLLRMVADQLLTLFSQTARVQRAAVDDDLEVLLRDEVDALHDTVPRRRLPPFVRAGSHGLGVLGDVQLCFHNGGG